MDDKYYILAVTNKGPCFVTNIIKLKKPTITGERKVIPIRVEFNFYKEPREAQTKNDAEYICDVLYQSRYKNGIWDAYVVAAPNEIVMQPSQSVGNQFKQTFSKKQTLSIDIPMMNACVERYL